MLKGFTYILCNWFKIYVELFIVEHYILVYILSVTKIVLDIVGFKIYKFAGVSTF